MTDDEDEFTVVVSTRAAASVESGAEYTHSARSYVLLCDVTPVCTRTYGRMYHTIGIWYHLVLLCYVMCTYMVVGQSD